MRTILFIILLTSACYAKEYAAKITAYCACKKCCGKWADGITASGKKPIQGRTLAMHKFFPFGTKVYVQGKLLGICQDRGNPKYIFKKSNDFICIDVYFEKHKDAKNFGVRYAIVKIKKEENNGNK